MTKYRVAIALLWGIGFTSLVSLLLNLNWVIGILLFPGGLATAVLSKSSLDPVAVVFAANVIVYTVVAFIAILWLFRNAPSNKLRRIAAWSMIPVTTVAVLACFPSMNPLWPHGMAELARQELELQEAMPLGMSLNEVRDVLKSRKIQFNESAEPTGGIVLHNPQATITAQAGDTVLVSGFQTEAFEFPCGYDMEIVLLFGHDGNVKERYIRRFPMCP